MKYDFDEIINRKGTNSFKYDFVKPLFGNDNLLPMWVADMDFKTPDFIIQSIKNRLNHEILGYTIKSDNFYNSLIHWVKKRYNWDIQKKWVLFSPGVVPSLGFCIRALTKPGDKIIVQPPVYHPFFHIIHENSRKVVYNYLINNNGKYSIDYKGLEDCIDGKTKMIFISNPHNPVGRAWDENELKKLGETCIKNNIIIVSDEIHADIVYKPKRHIALASISPEISKNTITLYSPSKTFNLAGMASSAMVIQNKAVREKIEKEIQNLHIGLGNILGLIAFESAYTNGEEWLDELLIYLNDNIQLVHKFFKNKDYPVSFEVPEATFLLWLNCRNMNLNDNELKTFFTNNIKIALNEGIMFGPGGEGYQRMNIACPRSIIIEALQRIKSSITTL
ncbi:MAG: PatB family C-S lyase [Bacteroidales bacterium]|nr:PatB family C-S lyase [Bacteroidales bacterium]